MSLTDLTAVELSGRIRRRDVSCKAVMSDYLARIETLNPTYNAIVNLRPGRELLAEAAKSDEQLARGEYLGWMHGMPQAIKDLAWAKGLPATSGSKIFEKFIPDRDSLYVERVKAAGAIVIGKTNTPEFGLGSNTFNGVFGRTLNAIDPSRSAGGSSGGAAVAVALGMLPVADGSDMMGSLRNPAAFNSVVGMRPSLGRVPGGPSPEVFFQQFATIGPMGRNTTDVAHLLMTQAGYHIGAPFSLPGSGDEFAADLTSDPRGLRIGWLGDLGGHLAFEPEILDICRAAIERMSLLGCEVVATSIDFDMEKLWRAWLVLRQWSVSNRFKDLYHDPAKRPHLKPDAVWEIERGLSLKGTEIYDASVVRSDWYRAICRAFETYDCLALPAAQVFPYDVNLDWPAHVGGRAMDTYHRWMEVVVGASIAGLPVIGLPAGFGTAGLPAGIQMIGRPRSDQSLLRLAHAYERIAASHLSGIKPQR